MALLWVVQARTKNGGIVDVAWSFGTGLCAVFFAFVADGDPNRRLVVALIAGFWGLRLGVMLAKRVLSESEDGRYKAMRERWGEKTQIKMFGFFQIQAFWAMMFALPMLAASLSPLPLGWVDSLAVLIWAVSIIGESMADAQLARFRGNPANKGKVCEDGLWAWSRHPNYFFEWLHWFSYLILALGGSLVWLAALGPVVMFLFLTKVTGIPTTEARALVSRGDAYRDYQRRVSVLVPWPPKPKGGL